MALPARNGSFRERFADEVAAAAGLEPVAFRRQNYEPRWVIALDRLTELSGYRPGTREVDGERRAMGVALQKTLKPIVGQAAQVSVRGGTPHVHAIWCVFDLGSKVMDPNITR